MSWAPSLTWSVSPFIVDGLRWFTLFWVGELVVGAWLLARQLRRGGGDDADAADLAVYAWLGLFLGARLGEMLFYSLDVAIADPAWILRLGTGGISGHGAVIGAVLAARLYASRRSLAALEVTDRLVFSFAAGAVLHRLGSWFNSDVVGKPTDGSWGVSFPYYDQDGELLLRHPSQLYESALGVALFWLLFLADRHWGREQRPRGALTGLALFAYFSGRFAVEFLKARQQGDVAGSLLNQSQWLSLPFIVVGAVVLRRSLRRGHDAGWRLLEETSPGAP